MTTNIEPLERCAETPDMFSAPVSVDPFDDISINFPTKVTYGG